MPPALYQPVLRSEFLDRLTLGEEVDWNRVHEAVQSVLEKMDAAIQGSEIRLSTQASRVASPGFRLFSYRVFDAGVGSDIDSVVVGIMFKQQADRIFARGTIAGEEKGDLLMDAGTLEAALDTADVVRMAKRLAENMAREAATVLRALQDVGRRLN